MNTFARTALLSLALATTGVVSEASAQNTVADWVSYMPLNGGRQIDTNRDGWVDYISYDINRDGWVEAARVDSNFGRYLDVVALDTNRNGVFDQLIFDTNRDGHLETAYVDNNGDSYMDVVGYDLNRTGYYSGWTSLSPPAQRGNTSGWYQDSAGHWSFSVGGNADGIEAHSAANAAFNRLLDVHAALGHMDTGDWVRPVDPKDYGTPRDPYWHTRRRADGTLYSTGRR